MEKVSELSVFFPAYNEEANIVKTVEQAAKILPQIASKYEIIIVDDGSGDRTGEMADQLARSLKFVKVIHHQPNQGYGASLRSGFYNSQYAWIAFTDADGQFDFTEITKFLKKQKETNADLVIGYYLQRAVSFYRKINSFLWQLVIFLLFGLKVRDIDCGFKLLRRKVIETIPRLESERGAFISSELLVKAQKSGFKIVEIGVHHFPDLAGGSTGASPKVIFNSFIDLVRLWKKLR